jgi:hypothetical protein
MMAGRYVALRAAIIFISIQKSLDILSVPHPKYELGKGIVHKLLKQAGLK